MNLRTSILLGTVLLSACQNMPEAYAPPVQRPLFDHFTPYRVSHMVNMSDGDANAHIVRDIWGETGSWRWTGKHPEVRVLMRTNHALRYVIDFTIVEATFKDTGPLQFSFYVNGHLLDRATYDSTGGQHFEKPVPFPWIQPGENTLIGAEVDKVWTSPQDHQTLGFILTRMGLTQE